MGLFCDNIVEAGWLTAAIITPLFFNWYSNRVFEASKVALLRSIAVTMLAAWLIKVLEARSWKLEVGSWKPALSLAEGSVLRAPLVIPTLILAGVYILTTITSVVPRVSFWGSYHRRQGLYVVLCYIAIFLLMLDSLRTRRQLERLLTIILLTSLPVSLYGIMQHYRVDPLIWIERDAYRVESTLGNPILIGAYLIMVVPLTVGQLMRALSLPPFPPKPALKKAEGLGGLRGEAEQADPSLILCGCYLLLLLLQLICLVFTQSRGPMMGFMAGALFFFLLLATLRGRRGLALATVGVSIVLFAILAVLNLPHTPLEPAKEVPFVERLTVISRDITEDRSLIWDGAVNMMTADALRAVIGYGPETMGLIFHPYLHPDWAALKGYQQVADQCHNETLDAWVTSGLIGLAAYLALFGSIFYYGLKWLGLIASSRQRDFLIAAWLIGGFLGVLIPWLVEGSLRWAGVGIPAGLLLALVIYLLTSLFRQSPTSNFQLPTSNFQILLIILLSALVAHFVEVQFGIAITATRTYFWIYAALLAIIGHYWQNEPEPEAAVETSFADISRQRRSRRRRGRSKLQTSKFKVQSSELLAHSILIGLILATTGFDLITHQFDLGANGPIIFGLLLVIWLFGGIRIPNSEFRIPISDFSTYVLGSLSCFLPFIAIHAAIVLPGAGVERATFVYHAYVFLIILAVATALTISSIQGSKFKVQSSKLRHRALKFGFWMLSLLAVLWVFNINLKAAQADIYYKFALASEERGEIDKAISMYGQAIQLAPRWSQYYASLGWAYGLKAVAISDANQRVALFEESRKALEHAQQMTPSDPDIVAKVGQVYWNWASLTPDQGQKAEKLEIALAHYQQAVTLSPLNHGHLLQESIYQSHKNLASVYLELGRFDEALEEAKTARDLAPEEERPGLDDLIAQLGTEKK